MSKCIDITDKLNFSEKTTLKIKNKSIVVKSDAPTMLKVMEYIGEDSVTPKAIIAIYSIIFSSKDREEIDKLSLSFADLTTVINSAIELIVGSAQDSVGE